MYLIHKKTIFILLSTTLILTLLSFFYKKNNKLIWTSINACNTTQGDAHIITKNGKYFMVDTGAYKERKFVLKYLKDHNITTIDSILITHPHFDHYGGVIPILENNITVKNIYMNIATEAQMKKEYWGGKFSDLLHIIEIAKKYNITVKSMKKGDKFIFDKQSYIDVLYAYDGINTPVGLTDINDMSVIMMIHDGNNKFLLTGDLDKKLGGYLAKHTKDIKADILKAPHHGTEGFPPNKFFDVVAPKVVIVPAYEYLWCKDRSKRMRELVKDKQYRTYINGPHGDITVTSYNNKYIITTQKTPSEICKEKK